MEVDVPLHVAERSGLKRSRERNRVLSLMRQRQQRERVSVHTRPSRNAFQVVGALCSIVALVIALALPGQLPGRPPGRPSKSGLQRTAIRDTPATPPLPWRPGAPALITVTAVSEDQPHLALLFPLERALGEHTP